MKFATWNIACGADGYYGKARENIAQWILDHKIDICVMQETDRFAERSDFIDFPAFFSEKNRLPELFYTEL